MSGRHMMSEEACYTLQQDLVADNKYIDQHCMQTWIAQIDRAQCELSPKINEVMHSKATKILCKLLLPHRDKGNAPPTKNC